MAADAEGGLRDHASGARAGSLEDVPLDDASEAGDFLIDNSELKATTDSLGLRRTKRIDDLVPPAEKQGPVWGSTLQGVDEGDGWLRVGRYYLPMKIGSTSVVRHAAAQVASVGEPDATSGDEEEEEEWYEFKVVDPDEGEIVAWVRRSQCAWTAPAQKGAAVESESCRSASEELPRGPNFHIGPGAIETLTAAVGKVKFFWNKAEEASTAESCEEVSTKALEDCSEVSSVRGGPGKSWRDVFNKMIPGSGTGASQDPPIFGAGAATAERTCTEVEGASPESCVTASPPATWSLKQRVSSGLMQVRAVVSTVSTKGSSETTDDDDVFSIGTGSEDFSDFEEECLCDGQVA